MLSKRVYFIFYNLEKIYMQNKMDRLVRYFLYYFLNKAGANPSLYDTENTKLADIF